MSDAPVTATPAAAPAATTNTAPAQANAPAQSGGDAAPQTAAEIFEVISAGKTEKLTRAEVLRRASIVGGANKMFEEASVKARAAEEVISKFKDPKQVFKTLSDPKFGLSREQIIAAAEEWYVETVVKPSEMTPEQRELAEAKARLAEYEAKQAEKEKADLEEQEKLKDQEEAQKITAEVLELLKEANLPKTKFVAGRLAHWIRVNESKGIKAPAALIIEQVRGEAKQIMSSLLEGADGDVLISLAGEQTVKKIRDYDLKRIRERRGQAQARPVSTDSYPASEPGEKISMEEVQRRARDPKLWN